jgi:hypothetical protein
MTKRHSEAIARILKESYERARNDGSASAVVESAIRNVARDFCDLFSSENPRFEPLD